MDKEDVDLILGKDLNNSQLYKFFVETRTANHQPVPPAKHIGMAGHHWVQSQPRLSGSADAGDLMVVQWSPSELRWYVSNQLATTAKPIFGDGLLTHWKWLAHVPLPDIGKEDSDGDR